jgi:two-component system sensor histidine kinase DegS
VRRFIADLRPPALDQLGLAGALRELAGRFANAVGLDVRFEGMQLPRLAPEQELVIYRIAQEALNNAAKHAKGASILVRCGTHANLIYLQVRDDGPGFDPRTVAARTRGVRWGLRSMHERADLIGAKFQISSAIGKGTTIGLSLPIKGTEDR